MRLPASASARSFVFSLLLRAPISSALTPSSAPLTQSERFLILRHGETDFNAAGIIQGSSDASVLSALGKEQASRAGEQLAAMYASESISRVLVSPLGRAQQTLNLCREALLLPKERIDHQLREVDLWAWEGRDKHSIKREEPMNYEAWKGDALKFSVSGRQPIVDLWARARQLWVELRQQEPGSTSAGTTLLVCHNAIGQAMLATSLGEDEHFFRSHKFPNCGALEIEWPIHTHRASRWRWRLPSTMEWSDESGR